MQGRSAIWGGATLGLIVGVILGCFVGKFWTTLAYAVLVGAGVGMVAEVLGRVGDALRRRQ